MDTVLPSPTAIRIGVSILVLMDYLFGLSGLNLKLRLLVVSILVLMDYLFGRALSQSYPLSLAVSILVLMDYLFGLERRYNSNAVWCKLVSILVLMDYLFGQPVNWGLLCFRDRFCAFLEIDFS